MTATPTDRSRWVALVVLCAGMLMIILDQTIVNVALPTIQSDLGFSQSSLAWVVNAYLIALRRPAPAGRAAGRPPRPQADLPRRPGPLHARVAAVRRGADRGDADRRALRAGRRRRDDLRGHPRHDRHDVPAAARAGQGDRRSTASSPRRAPRSACSPAASSRRRSTGTGSSSSTCRSASPPRCWPCGCSRTTAAPAWARAPTSRGRPSSPPPSCSASTRSSGTVDHGWGSAHTLGFGAAALALLAGFVARQATASRPLVPLRIFRSRNVSGANIVQALMVAGMFGMFFLGDPLPPARPGLRRRADRRRLPARVGGHRRALARVLARG